MTAILRMLTSGHHFLVENERLSGIPRELRTCPDCNRLDDEFHALFECPRYRVERNGPIATIDQRPDFDGNLEGFVLSTLREHSAKSEVTYQIPRFFLLVLKNAFSRYQSTFIPRD